MMDVFNNMAFVPRIICHLALIIARMRERSAICPRTPHDGSHHAPGLTRTFQPWLSANMPYSGVAFIDFSVNLLSGKGKRNPSEA